MESVSMPVMVRFQYKRTEDGRHFLGMATIPRPQGKRVVFKVMVPMSDVQEQVTKFLDTQGTDVSGDPRIAANIDRIHNSVAEERARRRLRTAIKVWRGGKVAPYEVAGTTGFATRMAQTAADKGGSRALVVSRPGGIREGYDPQTDIGWGFNPFKAVVSAAKAVGKGVAKGATVVAKPVVWTGKKVGSGVATGAKAVGSGTVSVAKGGWSLSKGLAKNPLTAALISVIPGGAAALSVVNAVAGGSPGAQEAVVQTAQAAQAGNPQAAASVAALQAAEQQRQQQLLQQQQADAKKPPIALYAAGGVGALALVMLAMKK